MCLLTFSSLVGISVKAAIFEPSLSLVHLCRRFLSTPVSCTGRRKSLSSNHFLVSRVFSMDMGAADANRVMVPSIYGVFAQMEQQHVSSVP